MTLPYNDDDDLFDEYTSLEDLLNGEWLAPRLDLSDPENPINRGKIHFFTEENPLSVCAHRRSHQRDLPYHYNEQLLEGEDQPDPRKLCAMCTQLRFQHRAQPKITQVRTAQKNDSILGLPAEMTPVPRAALLAVFNAERNPVASFVITRFHGLQDGVARFSVDNDLERTFRLKRTLSLALQGFDGLVEFLVPEQDARVELIRAAEEKYAQSSKPQKKRPKPARVLRVSDPSLLGPGPDGGTYSLDKIFG